MHGEKSCTEIKQLLQERKRQGKKKVSVYNRDFTTRFVTHMPVQATDCRANAQSGASIE